eukprot:scaffold51340_cov62-Attheya_sp.AAC.3
MESADDGASNGYKPRVLSKITHIPGKEGSDGEEIIQDDYFSFGHLEESDGEDDKTSESGDEEFEESKESKKELDESEENLAENEEESVTDAAAQAAAPVDGQRKHLKRKCPSQYDTR